MEGRPLDALIGMAALSRQTTRESKQSIAEALEYTHLDHSKLEQEPQKDYGRPLVVKNFSEDDYLDAEAPKPQDGGNGEVDNDQTPEVPRHAHGDSVDSTTIPLGQVPTNTSADMATAQAMFDDFDGEHAAGDSPDPSIAPSQSNSQRQPLSERRPSSNNRESLFGFRPKSYADPLTGQTMVYYPAPVPSMLQLPTKLSSRPSAQRQSKRATQLLSTLSPKAAQAAPWLPDVLEGQENDDRVNFGDDYVEDPMPEQLKANQFFEQAPQAHTVRIKEQSAVKTLDSILDASAFAPVTAFTDHAFAGRLGREVYGAAKEHRKSRADGLGKDSRKSTLLKGKRNTVAGVLGLDKTPEYEAVDDPDAQGSEDQDEDEEPYGLDEAGEEVYTGAPTTLLAELQLRKQQAKQRTQPQLAPGGFRSTLLELDAVAQKTSQNRRGKRVTLAWQQGRDDEEDEDETEDLPLGVLYPEQAVKRREDRPLGLIERRHLEDNEPLSARRARLLGIKPMPRASTMGDMGRVMDARASRMTLNLAGNGAQPQGHLISPAGTGEPEQEGPLPRSRPVSRAFSDELLSQFGPTTTDPPANEEEETLGQRRKRLLAEKAAREREMSGAGESPAGTPGTDGVPLLKQRRSMADILSASPAPGAVFKRSASRDRLRESTMAHLEGARPKVGVRSSTLPVGAASAQQVDQFPHLRERERELARQRLASQGGIRQVINPAAMGLAGLNAGLTSPGVGGAANPWESTMYAPRQPNIAAGHNLVGNYQAQRDMSSPAAAMGVFAPNLRAGLPGSGMGFGASTATLAGGYPAQQGMQAGGWMNQQQQWAQWAGVRNQMGGMGNMGGGNQQHIDMVERWRRSVMPTGQV
jgi:hypothetical protein